MNGARTLLVVDDGPWNVDFCLHLVEAQGGRIWAESEPGRGSRFAFRLPRQARVAQGHAADAESRT